MSVLVGLVPVAIAAGLWWGVARLNRRVRWLRTGDIVFWDAVLLVAVYLVWLRWF